MYPQEALKKAIDDRIVDEKGSKARLVGGVLRWDNCANGEIGHPVWLEDIAKDNWLPEIEVNEEPKCEWCERREKYIDRPDANTATIFLLEQGCKEHGCGKREG